MRRGFTLLETMTVVAILAGLAAILYPVLASARDAGKRTACVGNLRQLHFAIELYRIENNASGILGNASQMGLPPTFRPLVLDRKISVDQLVCLGRHRGRHRPVYVQFWSMPEDDDVPPTWEEAVQRLQGATPLVVDPNHRSADAPVASMFHVQSAFAVTLEGSIAQRSRRGNPGSREWWIHP